MVSKYLAALAATALVAAPVAAAPINAASSLSVAKSVRASTPSANGNELAGRRRGGGIIVFVLAAVAVGLGIYIVADKDDNADSN